MRFLPIAFLLACLVPGLTVAAVQTFAIPGGTQVSVDVPEGWVASNEAIGQGLATLTFVPADASKLKLQVTPLPAPKKAIAVAELQKMVEARGNEMLPNSVEKKLTIRKLLDIGFYFTFTNPAPKAGDLPQLSQGQILADKRQVIFTIQHRDQVQPEFAQALVALTSLSLKVLPPVAKANLIPGLQIARDGTFTVKPVNAHFELKIKSKGYVLKDGKIKDEGKGVYFLFDPQIAKLPNLSLWIEPPKTCASLAECKKRVESELAGKSRLEPFTTPTFSGFHYEEQLGGASTVQVRAEFFKDGYWGDIHLAMAAGSNATAAVTTLLQALKNFEIRSAK